LPGFSQLFFYDFSEPEVEQRQGQSGTGGVVSRRAAKAYILSGVRLESSSGISDVWYSYVEHNAHLFRESKHSTTPSSVAISSGPNGPLNLPTFPLPPSLSPHPRPDIQEMETFQSSFNWYKIHSRPRPTKKVRSVAQPPATNTEGHGEDSTIPTNTNTPFSKASAHHSLCVVGVVDRERKADGILQPVEIEDEEQVGEGQAETGEEVGVEGAGEQDDTGEFSFEEWPVTASFSNALDTAMDELLVKPPVPEVPQSQVYPGLSTTTNTVLDGGSRSTSKSDLEGVTEAINAQTEGGETSHKRAHQDSDDCEESQCFPSTT
jgi:hypothetical protein